MKEILQLPSHRARSGYHFSSRKKKKKSVLCVAPAAGCRVPTAAVLQQQNMQSGGTVQRSTLAQAKGTAAQAIAGTGCRSQVAGAWNLDPMGVEILHMSEWIN